MTTEPFNITRASIEAAQDTIYATMPATPQYSWPQINTRAGCEVWVKHENHTPTGAFKIRGGLVFIDWLKRTHPEVKGVITATRGNHGQSIALAASLAGLTATVLVPHGNSTEKNAAMRAFGAELIEFGTDFDEARVEAGRLAKERGLYFVGPFNQQLVTGVATYAYELLSAHPDLDAIYVPIGCGSGICGCIAARNALGLDTEIIATISENAQTTKLSTEAGRLISTNTAVTFADGVAVREPVADALAIYGKHTTRFVTLSDDEIAEAVRIYFHDTHNLAEGAGAIPLAGLLKEKDLMTGKKVGVILCGGNIDKSWFQQILTGKTPNP